MHTSGDTTQRPLCRSPSKNPEVDVRSEDGTTTPSNAGGGKNVPGVLLRRRLIIRHFGRARERPEHLAERD